MKHALYLVLFLLMTAAAAAQKGEDSLNMTLFGHLNPVDTVGAHAALWGYTAPDGREYALFASQIGTHIIDITEKPIRQVAFIQGPRNGWREMKVYKHYAYIVSEGRDSGSGLQIVDLSDLPNSATLVNTESTHFRSAHTVFIRDHYLYAMGTSSEAGANGGAIILDLEPDPIHPRRVGMVNPYYYHDAWVRNDTLLGAAINGQGCDIYDISDKENPKHLATITYPYSGTHNAEITSDGGYVVTSDEVNFTPKTMKVWDIRDLNNITMVAEYTPSYNDIVHNVHVVGRYVIAAWYTAGVRIIDMVDPRHPREVGFYDTYPGSGGFSGVWEAYGFFPSGKVIAGDRQTGLYVLEFNNTTAGSLSGVIRNATTVDPLPGASVFVPELGVTVEADAQGRYYVGGVEGQSRTLVTNEFGYAGTSESFTLNGDMEHDILLTPLEFFTGVLRVRDREGKTITEFAYAVEPHLHSTNAPNGMATLLLPRDSTFTVTVGKWGYGIESVPVTLTQNNQEIVVTLRRIYQDNATLDLGWSYQSGDDAATTGRWARMVPYLGYIGSDWFHPQTEASGNPGGYVFVTGAPPMNVPPQEGDVNNGHTTLTSPPIDLSGYTRATLSFDLWFVHYKRDSLVDTFQVQVSNDAGGSWTTVYAEVEGRSGWHPHWIELADHLALTDRMRVRFRASDTFGNALVNAAIDNFEINGDGAQSGVPVIADESMGIEIVPIPNPARGGGGIHLDLRSSQRHLRLELYNSLGERVAILHDAPLASGGHRFDIGGDLPAGRYQIRVIDAVGKAASAGIVVLR